MNDVTKDLLEALRFLLSAHGEQLDLAFAQAHDAIARAEAALAEPQPDADGWIPWAGGEYPPPVMGVLHRVRFRCGYETAPTENPLGWCWRHTEGTHDIVAYRVVKP